MLTVCCLLVKGPVAYTPDYVVRLKKMVARYLTRPHRFVCLTDAPWSIPDDIETIEVPTPSMEIPAPTRGIWSKMQVFNPANGLTSGRILYLDLDVIVVADLSPIVDFEAPIALTEDAFIVERAHLNTDRWGRRLVRRFNGSVMVWDGGTQNYLWEGFSAGDALEYSTDQDLVGERAVDAKPLPLPWFPRLKHMVAIESIAETGGPLPAEAVVMLTKVPKNHIAITKWPWFDALWGGWAEAAA